MKPFRSYMKRKESSKSVNKISGCDETLVIVEIYGLFSFCYGIMIGVTSLKLTSSRCDVTEPPFPLKNPPYATVSNEYHALGRCLVLLLRLADDVTMKFSTTSMNTGC